MVNFFSKNQGKILTLMIFLYAALFSTLSLIKLSHAGYNALDLAIINQAFFNSAHGEWFKITIHSQSYLGDHFTPILLLLLPLYYFRQTPELLLILQSLIIGLGAWPLWKIAKLYLNDKWSWAIIALYLLNPITHNINLFEFHFLPFAISTLLWTIYFFAQKNWRWFLFWLAVSLLIREDVSLVTAMFGVLTFKEKRDKKWIFTPPLISIIYFGLALKIISAFAVNGSYKFLFYYSWLGNNLPELLLSPITKLPQILIRFFGLLNIEFILGSVFLLLFLPLLKKTYWWLLLLIYIQFFLGANGPSGLLLQTHYFSLFYPALLVSAILGLATITQNKSRLKIVNFLYANKGFGIMVFMVGLLYLNITLGPAIGYVKAFSQSLPAKTVQSLTDQIPKGASVLASYGFLSNLSSRENVYSLNYAYIGRQQFNAGPYSIPDNIEYLLIDFKDIINLQIQYDNPIFKKYLTEADNNLRQIIKNGNYGVIEIKGTSVLFQKNSADKFILYKQYQNVPSIDSLVNQTIGKINFLGYEQSMPNCKSDQCYAKLKLFWQAKQNLSNNYELLATTSKCKFINQTFLLPQAYGIYPTNEWQTDEIIETNYVVAIPPTENQCANWLELELVRIANSDKIGSYVREWNNYRLEDFELEKMGEKIIISLN